MTSPIENLLLVGVPFLSEPADLPSCDDEPIGLTEEQSLFQSAPFLCDACGEEDCDGCCPQAYLMTVRGRVEMDGVTDEMCPEFTHCYREERDYDDR